MISVKKAGELALEEKHFRSQMENTLFYTLSDSFHHILENGSQLKTLTYYKDTFSKNSNDGIVVNLLQIQDMVYADIYSTSPFTDGFGMFSQKEKAEIKISEVFLSEGFVSNQELTIQNREQAKKFFMEHDCSHENMQQLPERYEEYKRLNISKDVEESWFQWYERDRKLAAVKDKAGKFFDKLLNEDLDIPAYLRQQKDKILEPRLPGGDDNKAGLSQPSGRYQVASRPRSASQPRQSGSSSGSAADSASMTNTGAAMAVGTSAGASSEIEAGATMNANAVDESAPAITSAATAGNGTTSEINTPGHTSAAGGSSTAAISYPSAPDGESADTVPSSLNRLFTAGAPKAPTITSISQARKFYIAMRGSHARMREEQPELYAQYRQCGVTKAHEEKWRKKIK